MKKLIAVLAVLGMFSLTATALSLPKVSEMVSAPQEDTGSAFQITKTNLAMQVALNNFSIHAQEGSANADETEIIQILQSEDFMNQVAEILIDLEEKMAKLEQVNPSSEEEADALIGAFMEDYLKQIVANKNIIKITRLLINDQTAYAVDDLDFDQAKVFVFAWVAQLYGLSQAVE